MGSPPSLRIIRVRASRSAQRKPTMKCKSRSSRCRNEATSGRNLPSLRCIRETAFERQPLLYLPGFPGLCPSLGQRLGLRPDFLLKLSAKERRERERTEFFYCALCGLSQSNPSPISIFPLRALCGSSPLRFSEERDLMPLRGRASPSRDGMRVYETLAEPRRRRDNRTPFPPLSLRRWY